MSNSEAKLHLSLEDGVFEISGSELFVSQQIENFKEIILEALQNRNGDPVDVVEPANGQKPPPADPIPEGAKSEHGFDKKSFPRVLHIEDKDVKIIKKMPGANNAKKSVNTALAYLWGKRSVGVEGRRPQVPSATLLKRARADDGFLKHLGVDFQRRAPVQCLAWPCIE